MGQATEAERWSGHCGELIVRVARSYGVETIFTLSGAHVFPVYDGAVQAQPPVRLLDVRHEQTAGFAAEATGKLARRPGLAVVTAGPGVTNTVSPVAQAHFSGVPMVVVGGRAPEGRWGMGGLQELDHPPLVTTVTKRAETLRSPDDVGPGVARAFRAAASTHRGPAFVDVPIDALYAQAEMDVCAGETDPPTAPDPTEIDAIADLLSRAQRPVLILGTDVWLDGAEREALVFAQECRVPTITNGMARGILPPGEPFLVNRARSLALKRADLVIVVGTPLDFRLGFGAFGGGSEPPPSVVHVADSRDQIARHVPLGACAAGRLALVFDQLREATSRRTGSSGWQPWVETLRSACDDAARGERLLLAADTDPIHPARIYGELLPLLADDAVVIGDGGDFVSFAGKFVEPARPGCWLDPGPFGCLGAGFGAAIAARLERPSAQVTVLLGDGAAGFALAEIDTLVRHRLPVVIVIGNNSAWGLEKGPMQALYGYDVVADLAPRTAYHEVAHALGADGELVTDPRDLRPALERGYASGAPYVVNVITDVNAAYPRRTLGV